MADIKYVAEISTGDVSGAGTDAAIFLTLYGAEGQTQEVRVDHLAQAPNIFVGTFERGQTHSLQFQAADVGEIRQIKVRHDNSGLSAGWFVNSIAITVREHRTVFPCNEWLSAGEGFRLHHFLAPDMPPSAVPFVQLLADSGLVRYRVRVETDRQFLAGTEANVFIELLGDRDPATRLVRTTGLLPLGNRGFDAGAEVTIDVLGADVGAVVEVRLSHDNSGPFAEWMPRSVTVTSVNTGSTKVFPAGASLRGGALGVTLTPRGPKLRLADLQSSKVLEDLRTRMPFQDLDLNATETAALRTMEWLAVHDTDGNPIREPETLEQRFISLDVQAFGEALQRVVNLWQSADLLPDEARSSRFRGVELRFNDPAAIRVRGLLDEWRVDRLDTLDLMDRFRSFLKALEAEMVLEIETATALLGVMGTSETTARAPEIDDTVMFAVNTGLSALASVPLVGELAGPLQVMVSVMDRLSQSPVPNTNDPTLEENRRDQLTLRSTELRLEFAGQFIAMRKAINDLTDRSLRSRDIFEETSELERRMSVQRRDKELPAQLDGVAKSKLSMRRRIWGALIPVRLIARSDFLRSVGKFLDSDTNFDGEPSTSLEQEWKKASAGSEALKDNPVFSGLVSALRRSEQMVLAVSRVTEITLAGRPSSEDIYFVWKLALRPVNQRISADVTSGSLSLLDIIYSVFDKQEIFAMVDHFASPPFFGISNSSGMNFGFHDRHGVHQNLGLQLHRDIADGATVDTDKVGQWIQVPPAGSPEIKVGLTLQFLPNVKSPLFAPQRYIEKEVKMTSSLDNFTVHYYYYMHEFAGASSVRSGNKLLLEAMAAAAAS